MKFNWGHGITIFLIIFVATTIGVVVKISTDDAYNHELVSENYYEDELKYQEEIDKEVNASKLSSMVSYKFTDDGIVLKFPNDFPFEKVSGIIKMKRPSKQILDFTIPVKLDDSFNVVIPSDKLVKGKWLLVIDWEVGDEKFMFKDVIVL